MPEKLNARIRLLCLIELFNMYTDEMNILSVDEICEKLSEYGYDVTKRTVLADIKAINASPLKIVSVNKPQKGFYLANCYSYQAINSILEAVYSSDMISNEESEYIKSFLYRNVCIPTLELITETTETRYPELPRKTILSDVLLNTRLAIRDKKQLVISYARIIPGDAFSLSEREEKMVINPIRTEYSGGTLALVFTCANTPKKVEFINMHRIKSADIINESSTSTEGNLLCSTNFFNSQPSIASRVKTEWILIKFKNEDIEEVENTFPIPIEFRKTDDSDYCIAKIFTAINSSLVGWLIMMGDRIEILKPDSFKELLIDKAKKYYDSQKR